ncbi:DUF6907 domain-containing protein [Streptomyces sp. NPDC057382]|uniref:DUF6907 domain-containing protein n=1 Tax=unclassified Streptomyces TaxID=2593676 RepID=UPI00364255DC
MATTVQPAGSMTLPTSPAQRTGITVAYGASPVPGHGSPLDLWATPDMADYAYEAVYDASRISTADAEASIREQLAEHNVQVAAFLNEDGPLTARQRGADWMLRWGCTPWCVNDHTSPGAPEWHSTAPVETDLRNIDSANTPAENAKLPFLAARTVVANDKSQAYGRTTRVWLDFGTSTGEISPAKARQALEAMRRFVTDFEDVVEHAERSAADDFEGDPEIARLDDEYMDRHIRAVSP